MLIGIVGDIHWSKYSSIVRMRGDKYSFRLENCIKSINWAEQLFTDMNCSLVTYLGDFFDSPELTAEEITALKEIKWNNLEHYFLVGNHEMGMNDLSYSSSHLFDYIDIEAGSTVIDKAQSQTFGDVTLHFLPYVLEEHRKPFTDYVLATSHKNIVFSHNDIAGIQLGNIISKVGFKIDDIESNCDLFINGHLHNGCKITDKIINIGNLTGQNFSEDASKYSHCVFILDTTTMRIAVYENPYAINFYKLDACESEVNTSQLKSNSVVTLKCTEELQHAYKELLLNAPNVLTSRLIVVPTIKSVQSDSIKELVAINHLDKFKDYILNNLGTSEIVIQELEEVIK